MHNPIHNKTWTAQKGQGAFCDGKRIKVFVSVSQSIATILSPEGQRLLKEHSFDLHSQVSGCQTLEKCLLIQEMGATNPEKVKMVVKNMETFMPKVIPQCPGFYFVNDDDDYIENYHGDLWQPSNTGEINPCLRIGWNQPCLPGNGGSGLLL